MRFAALLLALASAPLFAVEPVMETLPLGSIRPEGWLRDQLQMQAEGLTGHAEELYDDIGKSDWLTGKHVGGQFAWERGPYYAKGLIALALTLDDAALKSKAKRWVDAILASQRTNGDFGPKNRNWWANMIAIYLLRDWADATGDERVVPFLEKYFAFQDKEFETFPIVADSHWAVARVGDELEVVLWLNRRTGKWLDFARKLSAQSADWTTFYTRGGDLGGPSANGFRGHIVNFMQGLKTPALQYLLTGDQRQRNAYHAAFDPQGWVMQRYGRPDRMINGTESLTDRSASQGTELCAIAERILSCQSVLAALGDVEVADDLEMVAYNSLPATLSPDGRGMRYYCLLNQPSCEDKFLCFVNNGGNDRERVGAICPSPHSGFGCCRSNFHFAWPKFVQSMVMRKDGGLAITAYGPCRVKTTVNGQPVELKIETEYPFDGKVVVKVEKGGNFPLFLRIPTWTGLADAGKFRRQITNRAPQIELNLPLPIRTSFWANNAVAIARGPLLYALKMKAEEKVVSRYRVPYEKSELGAENGFPRKEILPKSPWNYALRLDANKLPENVSIKGKGRATELEMDAIRTDFGGWGYMHPGAHARAMEPPVSPIPDEGGPTERITLAPLALTQIRITLFPFTGSAGTHYVNESGALISTERSELCEAKWLQWCDRALPPSCGSAGTPCTPQKKEITMQNSTKPFVWGEIAECAKYRSLHPLFAKAMEFLARPDLAQMPIRRYEIEPGKCWAMVQSANLTSFGEVQRAEVHRDYIDIQAPLDGPETYGLYDTRGELFQPFDPEKDIGFAEVKSEPLTLRPGQFAIFFPISGAHAPCKTLAAPTARKKLVIKVRQ